MADREGKFVEEKKCNGIHAIDWSKSNSICNYKVKTRITESKFNNAQERSAPILFNGVTNFSFKLPRLSLFKTSENKCYFPKYWETKLTAEYFEHKNVNKGIFFSQMFYSNGHWLLKSLFIYKYRIRKRNFLAES